MPVIVLKPMNILRPFLIRCFFSYDGPLALYHIRLDHLYEPNNVFDPMWLLKYCIKGSWKYLPG